MNFGTFAIALLVFNISLISWQKFALQGASILSSPIQGAVFAVMGNIKLNYLINGTPTIYILYRLELQTVDFYGNVAYIPLSVSSGFVQNSGSVVTAYSAETHVPITLYFQYSIQSQLFFAAMGADVKPRLWLAEQSSPVLDTFNPNNTIILN